VPLGFAEEVKAGIQATQCSTKAKLSNVYIYYGVYDGTPYELGMEGAGQPIFTHKMYVWSCTLLEVSSMNDNRLDLFIKDTSFNYALEQTLESLDNPEALAKVARL